MTALALGQLIAGRYRVEALIASGGQAHVYRAEQAGLRRKVAIKLLQLSAEADPQTTTSLSRRFEQEALLLSQLRDPHTITLFDYGELEDGSLYMVFEYIDGQSLKDVIEREGQVAPERVARILLQTLASLQEAHELGVLHRDIKPQNIMLYHHAKRADLVKLLDFGIAKMLNDARPAQHHEALTGANLIVGTPRYLAPEIFQGAPHSAQTDLYSLGLVAYELLTGQPAIGGATPMEVMRNQIMLKQPPRLPATVMLSARLRAIITRLLALRPEARYASADEALAALLRWQERDPTPALGTPREESPTRVLDASQVPWLADHVEDARTQRIAADALPLTMRGLSDGADTDDEELSPDAQTSILTELPPYQPRAAVLRRRARQEANRGKKRPPDR